MMTLAMSMAFAAAAPVSAGMVAPIVAPIVVTDVVTGGPGAYTHNFTLTNNIGGTNTLYFFGVELIGTIIGTPASWAGTENNNSGWSNSNYGGSSIVYPNTWCCASEGGAGTGSGTTSTGFSILSSVGPSTINFFAFAAGDTDSANDGHFSDNSNPGFEGLVSIGAAGVPEPAIWFMMIGGLGAVGYSLRRNRNQALATA
jgi:hypothetical protein